MRKNLLIFFALFVVVLFVQSFLSLFLERVFLNSFILAFVFFLVIFGGLKENFSWKLFLLAGFLSDLYLFYPLGINMLVFFLAFLSFLYFKNKFISLMSEKSFLSLCVFVFVLIFSFHLIFLVLFRFFAFWGVESFVNKQFEYGLGIFLMNLFSLLIVVFPMCFLVKKFSRIFNLDSSTLIVKR